MTTESTINQDQLAKATTEVVMQQLIEKNKQQAEQQADFSFQQQLKELSNRNINYIIKEIPLTDEKGEPITNADGSPSVRKQIEIVSIPEPEKWAASVFAGVQDCWFPECEALRAEFEQRLQTAAAQDGVEHCSNCARARIIRSMHKKVLDAVTKAGSPPEDENIFADAYRPSVTIEQTDANEIPRTREVSGSAQESTGTDTKQEKVSFMRRILDRIAAAFGYSRQA